MKVLFDSNVYISHAIFGGQARLAVLSTAAGDWKIFSSDTILRETRDTARTKFSRSRAFANALIQTILRFSNVVDELPYKYDVLEDSDDTPILAAALHANADYLVTGDSALLELKQVESVRIVSLAEYLDILRSHGFASD